LCDEFITQAKTDKPYDIGSLPREPLSPAWILVSLIVGLILSCTTVGKMKAKLVTVRTQAAADSYIKPGTLNINDSREMFLYRNVTRTQKPKNNSSSGGSSTHTSSSGTTHGGGGGKF
ncbi:MAG: TPM domain-containing protein, partial [Clostridiales bacterium]|nr:TPM domain-containing protein [Clostridiales bacterium]